jgi:H+-transporting ATPase
MTDQENFEKMTPEETLKHFDIDQYQGLTDQMVEKKLQQYGENILEEKKESLFKKIFSFFWGPIPWMIEIAAILSGVLKDWPDFILIMVLLFINASLGFFHEFQAGNAIEALKSKLALKARVLRGGKWQEVESKYLVPGDIISVKLGKIIPADMKLLAGEYLSVDQSALTGESLPVDKTIGDVGYSGTVVKRGEMTGIVTATGMRTFFGKTAQLVQSAHVKSHLQEAIMNMGHFLITSTLVIVVILFIVSLYRIEHSPYAHESLGQLIVFVLVLVVAGIPVALPSVMSVTLAIGSHTMSKMKAIVSKLMAIEELAGMDILCSDKTGTLTKNQLTVGDIKTYEDATAESVLLCACLSSQEDESDAIDKAIMEAFAKKEMLSDYTCEKFIPFDPVRKRTEATLIKKDGGKILVSKGAPQIIVSLSDMREDQAEEVMQDINAFASRGFRTLGVAKSIDEGKSWTFLGLIPLSDPPRDDTKETIEKIQELGVRVQMVTGDHSAIAKEIAGELGMGKNFITLDQLHKPEITQEERNEMVEKADGYAEVFPEHKFEIVKDLQQKQHIVGMTGDGVNDAPALKQSDIGIAVSGATDAARVASDLVLTEPGLMVISRAIEEARRIFGRLKSYAIYRVSETYRLLLFLLSAMLVFDAHPLSAIMIILIALLNDIPIMMIAYDHMEIAPKPVKWDMKEVLLVAVGLAIVNVISTFGLYWFASRFWGFNHIQCSTLSFFAILCGGNLTIYLTRNRGYLFSRPLPQHKFFLATLFTQVVGTLATVYGVGTSDFIGIGWEYTLYSWVYIAVWFLITMLAKHAIYYFLEGTKREHRFEQVIVMDLSSMPISDNMQLRIVVEKRKK